jgi:hypothetical protein
MKVLVQNGANHCLSRREVEAMLPFFPTTWASAVDTILLSHGSSSTLVAKYYPKARELSLECPEEPQGARDKTRAVTELLVALAFVAEHGVLPNRIGSGQRRRLDEAIGVVIPKCVDVLTRVSLEAPASDSTRRSPSASRDNA